MKQLCESRLHEIRSTGAFTLLLFFTVTFSCNSALDGSAEYVQIHTCFLSTNRVADISDSILLSDNFCQTFMSASKLVLFSVLGLILKENLSKATAQTIVCACHLDILVCHQLSLAFISDTALMIMMMSLIKMMVAFAIHGESAYFSLL